MHHIPHAAAIHIVIALSVFAAAADDVIETHTHLSAISGITITYSSDLIVWYSDDIENVSCVLLRGKCRLKNIAEIHYCHKLVQHQTISVLSFDYDW